MSALEEWTCVSVAGLGLTAAARLGMPLGTVHLERPARRRLRGTRCIRSRLDAIPTGRPAVIVADGMMAFLSQEELVSLWDRLIKHFPSGEIAFNSYTRFTIWIAQRASGTKTVANQVKFPGMDDPHAPEWNPKIKLVKEILLSREPEVAEFPPALRRYHRLAARSTAWSRTGTIVVHYRF